MNLNSSVLVQEPAPTRPSASRPVIPTVATPRGRPWPSSEKKQHCSPAPSLPSPSPFPALRSAVPFRTGSQIETNSPGPPTYAQMACRAPPPGRTPGPHRRAQAPGPRSRAQAPGPKPPGPSPRAQAPGPKSPITTRCAPAIPREWEEA